MGMRGHIGKVSILMGSMEHMGPMEGVAIDMEDQRTMEDTADMEDPPVTEDTADMEVMTGYKTRTMIVSETESSVTTIRMVSSTRMQKTV